MIITKTPFRISFFGGGSDYPAWFDRHGGAVLSTTIDKYCYITCRYLPPFFDYKSRVIWTKMQNINDISEIEHPVVREALRFLSIEKGVEIHHDADLPARAGLGSSSAFTVGLLNALYILMEQAVPKERLARDAIRLEQEILKENVGNQDQVAAAYGGFNRIEFGGELGFDVVPIILPRPRIDLLQDHLMLFFTGFSRTASEIASEQIKNTKERINDQEIQRMIAQIDEALAILQSGSEIDDFGRLLHEAWEIKRGLSSRISAPHLDNIYEAALSAGALGGKLLGAGGGGFMVFFVQPERQALVKEKLSKFLHVPFRFENRGSQIIHHTSQEERV